MSMQRQGGEELEVMLGHEKSPGGRFKQRRDLRALAVQNAIGSNSPQERPL